MNALFGTVEYFEREIINNKVQGEADVSSLYSKLENELLYDFICDEQIRRECLKNLNSAYEKLIKVS